MGLFEKIFGGGKAQPMNDGGYFKTLTAYAPAFHSWSGKLYESELVRAAIDARARHISKLKVEIRGSAQPALQTRLRLGPNGWQTWSQFMYRLSTILDMQNTAFIVPVWTDGTVTGFFPVLPSQCELVNIDNNQIGVRYTFQTGEKATCYLYEVGIMTKFQYEDDFFGSSNSAMNNTMKLIDIQNQGIEEGVKSAATYRFMAQLSNFAKAEDVANERKRFNKENLSGEGGGLLLFPNTYTNIQQINSTPFTISDGEMQRISQNVFNYYGVNEDVLQNKALGDNLDAFFNGAIEPFSIQFSEVMTRCIFTPRERQAGAMVIATANRLQYMSVATKVQIAQQLGDRGMITINEARELFNYPPMEEEVGNKAPIRGEYYFADEEREDTNDGSTSEKTE